MMGRLKGRECQLFYDFWLDDHIPKIICYAVSPPCSI